MLADTRMESSSPQKVAIVGECAVECRRSARGFRNLRKRPPSGRCLSVRPRAQQWVKNVPSTIRCILYEHFWGMTGPGRCCLVAEVANRSHICNRMSYAQMRLTLQVRLRLQDLGTGAVQWLRLWGRIARVTRTLTQRWVERARLCGVFLSFLFRGSSWDS